MKKTLTTMAASLAIFTFLANASFAQSIAKIEPLMVHTSDVIIADHNISAPGNAAMAAKFAAMFPTAQNPVWSTESKGYWVSFISEGRTTSACFNTKGQLNYSIISCTNTQLSKAFQNFISKSYPGYQFFSAVQINAYGEETQQAILQNTTGFVTLQSTKDGIEEIKKVYKSIETGR